MSEARLEPDMARIAVIKPCCIGDCVMALPVIDAIIGACPQAERTVYVGNHSRAIFATRLRDVTLRSMPDRPRVRDVPAIVLQLRHVRQDAIVVLDRSRLLSKAASFSGARLVAMALARHPEQRHESEVYRDALREIGIDPGHSLPSIQPDATSVRESSRVIPTENVPFIVLHPGGAQNPGTQMLDKRWPEDRFVDIARYWSSQGYDIVISGGPGDRDVASRIAQEAQIPTECVIAGLADLMTTAAIIQRAALYVGADTGVSHVAAAVGTPTIAIFGPTNPRRYRPLGRQVSVLAADDAWNVPDMDLRSLPPGTRLPSTSAVTVDQVLAAGDQLLATPDGGAA